MATVTFETKSKLAVVYDYSKDLGFYLVWIHSTCANPKRLAEYRIKSIDGIKSLTALIRACKDPSNQFCPLPVSCDSPERSSQDGGNLPPPPVSPSPTHGGNLLQFTFKNSSVSFLKNAGFVLSVINIGDDKYRYPMSFENYYKIKKINDDCLKKHGFTLGLKRLIHLCKKYSYDKENAHVCVA